MAAKEYLALSFDLCWDVLDYFLIYWIRTSKWLMVKNGNPRKKGLVKLVYHLSDSLCKYLMIPVFNIGRTFLPIIFLILSLWKCVSPISPVLKNILCRQFKLSRWLSSFHGTNKHQDICVFLFDSILHIETK